MKNYHRQFFWRKQTILSAVLLTITAAQADSPQIQSPQAKSSESQGGQSQSGSRKSQQQLQQPSGCAAKHSSSHLSKSPTASSRIPTPHNFTEDEAISIVSKLPEVIKWQKELAQAKKSGAGTAGFMANKEKNGWTVQAFESFPDRNVTFSFYSVNEITRKAKKTDY